MSIQADTGDCIIGIDVAKDKLDIVILPQNIYYVIDNKRNAIAKFSKKILSGLTIKMVVMESTGDYERLAFEIFHNAGIPVHIAHPNRVYHFGKSKGYFAKTDKIDATMIAEYGMQNLLNASAFRGNYYYIKLLSTRITQLKEDLASERCRSKKPSLHREIAKSIDRNIKQLEREIKLIESRLSIEITQDEALKRKHNIICSLKGAGDNVANILITQVPDLGNMGKGQIAALCGVAPRNNDSGHKRGMRMIQGGKAAVRKALYLCALSAVRFNPKMKKHYDRIIAQGKKPKVGLIAVARKMVIILNAMIRDNKIWDLDYENTITA